MMNYYPNNFYQNSMPQPSTLLGKVVESMEVVKSCEVPFGGYGIYPKGDFSEIYIKTWNNDGTTRINKYQPVQTPQEEQIDTNTLLMKKFSSLEEKIDALIEQRQAPVTETKEIKSYGY